MQAMTAKLSGRRYHDGEIETLSQLTVRHENDNDVDSNAVSVLNGDEVIGYLERGLATMVAPLLDRGRPVLASPIKGKTGEINLFVPEAYERISNSGHLVRVPSSDGQRSYVVDVRRGLCTCPVGRFVRCRHQKALGVPPATPAKALGVPPAAPTQTATVPVVTSVVDATASAQPTDNVIAFPKTPKFDRELAATA